MVQQKTHSRKVRRLRQLRRSRELTQAELGRRVGLATATICSIEKGHADPSFEKAIDIAAVFGLPVEEVFEYVEVVSA